MKKWFKRMVYGILIGILVIVGLVHVLESFTMLSDSKTLSYFEEQGFQGGIEYHEINGLNIKVVADPPKETDSILLVFVHGAPGSWDAFKTYVTDSDINEKVRVVSYDRPGYGGSDRSDMPSILEQGEILKGLIDIYKLDKVILVGHSYGGPIAGLLGLGEESEVDEVIMIAPLVDPASEPLFWYSYFSYWKLTSWVLPKSFVVAGSEKFAHSSELQKIEDKWKDAKSNFIHIHGLKDGLAPGKENLDFSKLNIPEDKLNVVEYPDKGHLVIWTDYKLMKEIILEVISKLNAKLL